MNDWFCTTALVIWSVVVISILIPDDGMVDVSVRFTPKLLEVETLLFIASIVITMLIAAITVGYRSFRAAIANPVKSLRSE